MNDPELQAFCEAHPCLALEVEEFVDRNRQELKDFLEAHIDIPRDVVLVMAIVWQELGYPRQLVSFGKLWRARRHCDSCGCHLPAGEYLHMFRHLSEFTFKSFFICPGCEERWEKLGECSISEGSQ
jgi:hypothetical protein